MNFILASKTANHLTPLHQDSIFTIHTTVWALEMYNLSVLNYITMPLFLFLLKDLIWSMEITHKIFPIIAWYCWTKPPNPSWPKFPWKRSIRKKKPKNILSDFGVYEIYMKSLTFLTIKIISEIQEFHLYGLLRHPGKRIYFTVVKLYLWHFYGDARMRRWNRIFRFWKGSCKMSKIHTIYFLGSKGQDSLLNYFRVIPKILRFVYERLQCKRSV